MRPTHLVPLALAVALASCSSGTPEGDPDAGLPAGRTAAYWGLKDDLCLHYVDDQGRERYTIDIEEDDKAVPGVTTFHLAHQLQGLDVHSDWVKPEGEELQLLRRSDRPIGENDTIWSYNPAVLWLEAELQTGDARTTKTEGSHSGGTRPAGKEALEFTTSAFPLETMEILGKSVEAAKFTVSVEAADGSITTDKIWFVPEIGIVKYDPAGPDVEEMTLKSVEQLQPGNPCLIQ